MDLFNVLTIAKCSFQILLGYVLPKMENQGHEEKSDTVSDGTGQE